MSLAFQRVPVSMTDYALLACYAAAELEQLDSGRTVDGSSIRQLSDWLSETLGPDGDESRIDSSMLLMLDRALHETQGTSKTRKFVSETVNDFREVQRRLLNSVSPTSTERRDELRQFCIELSNLLLESSGVMHTHPWQEPTTQ